MYLAAGCALTVAVAWALALLPTEAWAVTRSVTSTSPRMWEYTVYSSPIGTFRAWCVPLDNPGSSSTVDARGIPSWSVALRTLPPPRLDLSLPNTIEDARGLPFLALRCEWQHAPKPFELFGGIAIPAGPWRSNASENVAVPRALPLVPIWSGLAADTVIFAALLFACRVLARAIRNRFRSKRNQCTRCGYRVGDSDICPECGTAVLKPRNKASPETRSA